MFEFLVNIFKKPAASTTMLTTATTSTTTTTAQTNITTAVSVPIGQTDSKTKQTMGLSIEKSKTTPTTSTTSVASNTTKPKTTSTDSVKSGKVKYEDPNPDATFERQTRRVNNNMSEEEWNKLSEEKKQELCNAAFEKIMNSPGADGITHDGQFYLYAQRCSTPEEVIRLNKALAFFSPDARTAVLAKDVDSYKTPELKEVALLQIAKEYPTYKDKESQREGLGYVMRGKSEKAKRTATQNIYKADVSLHEELTDRVKQEKNEDLENELANQVDKLGKKADGTVDTDIQSNCSKKIYDTPFQSVKENFASKIHLLDRNVQMPATQMVAKSNNEGAIKAAALNYTKCSKDLQNDMKSLLSSTKYESVNKALVQSELNAKAEQTKALESAKQAETASYANNTESVSSKYSDEKVADVIAKVEAGKDISKDVKSLTTSEQIAVLKSCSNPSVVQAIVSSGASIQVLQHLDVETLKGIDYKSLISSICFLPADSQIFIVEMCAKSGKLSEIRREFLKPQAKEIYDEKKKEIEIETKEK